MTTSAVRNTTEPARHFRFDHVVTADSVLDDAVVAVAGDQILSITSVGPEPTPEDVEPVGGWLVPGFVDTHVHGGSGADFATTDPDEVQQVLDFHRSRGGTTTTLASLVTAEIETLVRQIETLVPFVRSGEIAGIHLEGPFLSTAKCGAHNPQLLIPPERSLLDQLLEAGDGTISVVTIAPELLGGLDAVRYLSDVGVRVAFGHSDSDRAGTAQAIDAGATVVTHLFNAMRPIHHREPGPIPLLLEDVRVRAELICDGAHLDPDVINLAIAAAGVDRISLITDAMAAAGMSDGSYQVGGQEVLVIDGTARLAGDNGTLGSIAGSTLTMAGAFSFVVNKCGVSIPDAARMASTTPALAHGLDTAGTVAPGRRADAVVVDDHGRLRRVLRAGEWIEAL